jgi:hypothetical protein
MANMNNLHVENRTNENTNIYRDDKCWWIEIGVFTPHGQGDLMCRFDSRHSAEEYIENFEDSRNDYPAKGISGLIFSLMSKIPHNQKVVVG